MTSSRVKLNIRVLKPEAEFPECVLIEGNRAALQWFGKLLLNHAEGENGCGRQMFPRGPGGAYFAKAATAGFYLHLLPCDHMTAHSERAAGRKSPGMRRGARSQLGESTQKTTGR